MSKSNVTKDQKTWEQIVSSLPDNTLNEDIPKPSTDDSHLIHLLTGNLKALAQWRESILTKFAEMEDIETEKFMSIKFKDFERWEKNLYIYGEQGAGLNAHDAFIPPSTLPDTTYGARSSLALMRGLWKFYQIELEKMFKLSRH